MVVFSSSFGSTCKGHSTTITAKSPKQRGKMIRRNQEKVFEKKY